LKILLLPLIIFGCTSVPDFPDDHLDTARVVQNIKCEFRDAVIKVDSNGEWLKHWNAGFILSILVNHKGGVTVDATLTHPLTPGIFTLPFAGVLSGETKRTEKINFLEKVRRVRDGFSFPCPSEPASDGALLAGRIGILDLLQRARSAMELAEIAPTQLDYSLDFVIAKNANLSPRFAMIPIGSLDTITAGIKLEGSQGQTHTLNLSLVEKKPADCPEFADFFKLYKICPTVVATMPFKMDDKKGFRADDEAIRIRPGEIDTKKGITPQEQRDLERALDRSILQDTRQDLRRLDIPE
jgi:hypothetical protein